jgi:cobalt-zinc-cadmium efflux system outer membrane protein
LQVENDVQLGVEQLGATYGIAERYRRELLPVREMIVAESQKEVNFMLIGVFELLAAKQQEYDAYQEYLEAVRDYWISRVELRRSVGGRLPDDGVTSGEAVGVEAILPASGPDQSGMHGMDHSSHGGMGHADNPVPPSTNHRTDATERSIRAEERGESPVSHSEHHNVEPHDHHGDTP